MRADVNDIRIDYIDEGDGAPIVFLHGFPLSKDCWRPQIDAFSSEYRCIAPDLRGFGASAATPGTTTMDRFADDVAGLLTALSTGPVVLVAHSMGGYVTFAFARRFPDMLRGLVLVATRAGADTTEAAEGRRATAESVRSNGTQVVVDGMTPKMLASGNDDAGLLASVRGFMESASVDGMAGALLGMAERPDSTPDLSGITVPAFIVTGDEDVIIDPAESQAMADAIAGARLQVIPDAGHFVALEQPETFNAELREWLSDSGLGA
jgi:pimeloyl-ACP methyl ester carboxylesterase